MGSGRRDDVHDRAAANREQRETSSHQSERAPKARRQRHVEVIVRVVLERDPRHHRLRAVHEDLEMAMRSLNGPAGLVNGRLETDVADDRSTSHPKPCDLAGGIDRELLLDIDEDNIRPLLGYRLHDPATDALRSARDDCDLSLEYSHRRPPDVRTLTAARIVAVSSAAHCETIGRVTEEGSLRCGEP